MQKITRHPNKINTQRYTSRHITVKQLKAKEGNLKSSKRKMTHGTPGNNSMING